MKRYTGRFGTSAQIYYIEHFRPINETNLETSTESNQISFGSTASVKRYTERCGTSAQIEEQRKRRYILL